MGSIGETLRRERLKAGLELERVASETRIPVRFLQFIEKDEFDKLPGGVFTRSFVRQYARHLGLDEADLLNELHQLLDPQPEPAPTGAEESRRDVHLPKVTHFEAMGSRTGPNSSLPALALVVVVMLLCSFAYAWWQQARHPGPQVAQRQSVPAPVPLPQAERTQPPPAVPAQPVTEQPVKASPAQASPEQPAPVRPAELSTAAPAPSEGATRISLSADEPTWVSASIEGKNVYQGILQPNQTRELAVDGPLRIVVGNAGGLAVSVNGKPVGPIGPKGQVRIVHISREGDARILSLPKPLVDTIQYQVR